MNRFEFDEASLRRRAQLIDQDRLIADQVVEARALFDLTAEGIENIPREGPLLLLGNNPSAPMMIDGLLVSAHAIYTLDAVMARRGGPAWILAVAKYFELAERSRYMADMLGRMGFVPATLGNGVRLLQMGEAVLGYPEEKPSRPPYEVRPFSASYLRMAAETGAPVVPVVFMGTHESHLLIEHKGRQILVNKKQRFRTNFRTTFLPPIDVRARIGDGADDAAIEALGAELRTRMQAFIEREKRQRPLVNVVEQLQQRRLSLRRTSGRVDADIAALDEEF
jgi:1-acyl-sn-glycerol-3-phosphate acyltransferase